MTSLSQNSALAVFIDMVPPTASHSSNRAAGVTEHHLLRTASAAATIRNGAVTENRQRRRIQMTWRFPDDKSPDVARPAAAMRSLEPAIFLAQIAPESLASVACSLPNRAAQAFVNAQPVVFDVMVD